MKSKLNKLIDVLWTDCRPYLNCSVCFIQSGQHIRDTELVMKENEKAAVCDKRWHVYPSAL